jgi:hypothetical protein
MWTTRAIGRFAFATVTTMLLATACSGDPPTTFPSPPTSTRSPQPSPSALPTDQPGCLARPSVCGYPDESNTGVPAGTSLTVHEGDLTIKTDGTVIDGLDIRGCVTVEATNVTIRRSKITCTGYWGIDSEPGAHGGGLLIEDVEVDCLSTGGTAIAYWGFTARRVNLHHCENGVDIDADSVVEDSFIHDMVEGTDGHADGIQFSGGTHNVVRHNTILGGNGTSAIITGKGGAFNYLSIEGNLLDGGGFTVYCPEEPGSVGFRLVGNRFGRNGEYGPWTDCERVEERDGNIWDDTLTPVELD